MHGGKRCPWRKELPADLLAKGIAREMTCYQIAEAYRARTGQRINPATVHAKLLDAGMALIRHRRPGGSREVTVGVPDPGGFSGWTGEELRKLLSFSTLMDAEAARRSRDIRDLTSQARAGSLGALIILKEKYNIRLTDVEARVTAQLPWVRRERERSAEPCRERVGGAPGAEEARPLFLPAPAPETH